jgi:hypothetical protein
VYKVLSAGIVCENDIRVLKKQYELFKRYMKEDFEFICAVGIGCNSQQKLVAEINQAFNNLIHIIETPTSASALDYSRRASFVQQNALKHISPSKLFLVHADLFPVSSFTLDQWFSDFDMGGVRQNRPRLEYLWENMLYLDTTKIATEEIDFGIVSGGDTSSALSKIIPKYKVRFYDDLFFPSILYLNNEASFENLSLDTATLDSLRCITRIKSQQTPFHAPELHMGCFYHYRSGSGWHKGGAEKVHTDKIREACYDEILKL